MATTEDLVARARPRNARGHGAQLRDQLLEATVALLDREGDAARVSVRAIAKAAGVSPTALYLHFPDRDALVDAAVDRSFAAFNATLAVAVSADEEPVARLRAMALAYLAFAGSQPALYAVLFSTRRPVERLASTDSTATATAERVRRDEGFDGLITTVRAALGAGTGAEAETQVRELALVLWSALHGYAALQDRTPMRGWPGHEAYVDRLLRTHLGRQEPVSIPAVRSGWSSRGCRATHVGEADSGVIGKAAGGEPAPRIGRTGCADC